MSDILHTFPSLPSPIHNPSSPLSIDGAEAHTLASGSSSDVYTNGSPKTPAQTSKSTVSSPGTSTRSNGKEAVDGAKLGESSTASMHEEDPRDIGPEYIQPAEFYPLKNYVARPSNSWSAVPQLGDGVWLTPEEDKNATRGIPIFRPTMEEFQDFEAYVTKTVPWGQYSGITKIIPPPEWTSALPPISPASLASVRIKNPIAQSMLGRTGIFKQSNVERNKLHPLSVEEWFGKCNEEKYAGPGPKDMDRSLMREVGDVMARMEDAKRKKDAVKTKRGRRKPAASGAVEAEIEQSVAVDGAMEEEAPHVQVPMDEPASLLSPDHLALASDEPLEEQPGMTVEDVQNDISWYENFDLKNAWLPKDTTAEDYTPENCAMLERKFWKTLGVGEPSWYGADLQGSLFEDLKTPWNVANLPNLLTRLGRVLPGVNVPYLYFGMWRAAFAWHVEDMDLFSINYIHFGAPKFWYAIPQAQAEKFERTISGYFPQDAAACDQYLRHKSFVISPTKLAQEGVHVNMLVHNQNEFVITYPRGYHAGFNLGFNCAESVNFALDSWLELGRRAKVCQCVSHSVRIDVDELLAEQQSALEESKQQLETEEELAQAIRAERKAKRARTTNSDGTERPRKRRPAAGAHAVEPSGSEGLEYGSAPLPITGMKVKKIRISLNTGEKKAKPLPPAATSWPCILCPYERMDDMVMVMKPNEMVKGMCKAVDGIVKAHRACVNSIPEVWIERELETGQEWVLGVNSIPKDRWNLSCIICKSDKSLPNKTAMYGAKTQCTYGKCPRAYHVTCARDTEDVMLKVWEVEEYISGHPPLTLDPTIPEPETRRMIKTEVYCPTHNPNQKEIRKNAKERELRDRIMAILPGSTVKIRQTGGMFSAILVRAHESNKQIEIDTGTGRICVPWTKLDFKPEGAKMTENEYARDYQHSRRQADDPMSLTSITAPAHPLHPATYVTTPSPYLQQRVAHMPLPSHPLQPATYIPSHDFLRDFPKSTSGVQRQAPQPVLQLAPVTYYPPKPSINHMLNPSTGYMRSDNIPSRVVVCNSQYNTYERSGVRYATPTYAAGPPPLMTYGQPGYSHPQYNQPSYTPNTHSGRLPHASHGVFPTTSYPTNYAGSLPPVLHSSAPAPIHQNSASTPNYGSRHGVSGHPQLQTLGRANSQRYTIASAPPVSASGHTNGHTQAKSSSSDDAAQSASTVPPVKLTSSAPINNGIGKIDLGLQRMERLMSLLPPLTTPAIHLAGTNGKGSVSAILESCLLAGGMSTGRYNSPHLIEPRDAISINGAPPSREQYEDSLRYVHEVNAKNGIEATTFEIATAAAYYMIQQARVDVMVIECGMGGLRDATNVIPRESILASGLTSVGLDHTAFLGDTIAKITNEKARIIVPGGLLVVAPQRDGVVFETARKVAQEVGARIVLAATPMVSPIMPGSSGLALNPFTPPKGRVTSVSLPIIRDGQRGSARLDTRLSLFGDHQSENLSCALTILAMIRTDPRALGAQPKLGNLVDGALSVGVERTRWRGRCSWEVLPSGRGVLVDGAHNSDSAEKLRGYIDSLDLGNGKGKVTFLLGLSESRGKSVESVLRPLLRAGDRVGCVEFTTPVEGMPWVKGVEKGVVAEKAGEIVYNVNGEGQVQVLGGLKEGLDWAERACEEGLIVVCGSLYLVADFYRLRG